jgi:hypothetical protein
MKNVEFTALSAAEGQRLDLMGIRCGSLHDGTRPWALGRLRRAPTRFDFGCATVPDLATVLPAKGLKADTARGRQNSGLHHHRREIIRDGSQDFVDRNDPGGGDCLRAQKK